MTIRLQSTEFEIPNEPIKSKRARKHLITDKLATVLDKCKISDRDATHILYTFLEAVNIDPSEYVINRTSLIIQRQSKRYDIAEKSREEFFKNVDNIIIHWEGKILKNISGQNVERLAVIATTQGKEKLLGVLELPVATGLEISFVVYDIIEDWGLDKKVQEFVFDTTASNTGRINVFQLLERRLNRNIFFSDVDIIFQK